MIHRIENSVLDEESGPILVENFNIYKNKHGRWCYSFDTPNHQCLLRGEEGLKANERFISFETIDSTLVIQDGEPYELPNARVVIWLIPEDETEEEDIDDVAYCVVPKGWGYYVLLVPQEDFIPS